MDAKGKETLEMIKTAMIKRGIENEDDMILFLHRMLMNEEKARKEFQGMITELEGVITKLEEEEKAMRDEIEAMKEAYEEPDELEEDEPLNNSQTFRTPKISFYGETHIGTIEVNRDKYGTMSYDVNA